ncbi:MAG: acyl-CoA dehydrogenase family protein, partial [Gemmatimonadota bacterium]
MTDPLLELTEEQRAIFETARAFADEHLRPNAAAWDRDAHFEPSLIPQLGELGFLGMLLPPEHDGLGLDARSYLLALEEIAVADASTAVMMSVHNSLPTQMLLNFGSSAQQ